MKIAVGSANSAKLKAVAQAAGLYWPQAEITSVEVPSGVPSQPIGVEQTIQGATNRAIGAYQTGANLGVGLESGVATFGSYTILFAFVAVHDGKTTSVVPTSGAPLPQAWSDAVHSGKELGPFIAELFNDYNRHIGTLPFLTGGHMLREDVFTLALTGAFAPWATPQNYQQATQKEDSHAA